MNASFRASSKTHFHWGNVGLRYTFNGQEEDKEIADGVTTAMFWEYDCRLGRRWNVDPIFKEYESSYATFANSPIWITDPSGADSIFYNQAGAEINRVVKEGFHTYFLQHSEGSVYSQGEYWYQGHSYYSFFGDPSKFDKPTLFTNLDRFKFTSLSKPELERLVSQQYAGEDLMTFWTNSGPGGKFDYKNSKYFNANESTGSDATNITTAYIIDGIIYNRNEMGMFLWGATAAKTGVPIGTLSEWNWEIHEVIEGNGDEYGEMITWMTGYYVMSGWSSSAAFSESRKWNGADRGDSTPQPYGQKNAANYASGHSIYVSYRILMWYMFNGKY